ncbi:MAG: recombination mediator RecR [Gammaproteobacteria bacterium]|nr:recombination mediator RecR [Gammaproteobacteria bacterium]
MANSQAIDLLKQALRRLPGVGPKTAQRMAFHLLERDRDGAREIAEALRVAIDTVKRCRRCNTFSETPLCSICESPRRDASLLCIVETPADLESVENASVYQGMYFVLMGHLSPLDGIGPDDLGFDRLDKLLNSESVQEVIVATNLTVEGEATAEYLHQLLEHKNIKATRLARGVPVGGELEYMDQGTLTQAFEGRRAL